MRSRNGPSAWQGRFVGPLLAANVLVVGLTATLLTVGALREDQAAAADRVMDQRTAVARAAVLTETGRYRDLMRAMAAGLGTDTRLSAGDFTAATAPLDQTGLPGITSVAFVVAARPGEIAGTQRLWRTRGVPDLVLRPAGTRDEHYFTIFQRPLNGGSPGRAGLDVAGSPEGTAALIEARGTGRPAVSDAYVLLRDRGLPEPQQQLSFVFVAPMTAAGARGWLTLGVHGQDFLGGVLGAAGEGRLDARLLAGDGQGAPVEVASYDAPGRRDLTREDIFRVETRQWTLITAADSRNLPGARNSTPTTVLLGGFLVSAMLALLVWVLATGRSRARTQVLVATAELRAAEADSRRQAALMSAVMNSIGDGVGVVDEDGRFLLHNPAAKGLLGIVGDIDDPQGWQEYYGLFRADGRTPFPLPEMPLIRALRGESSDGVEMLIRNPQHPEGILVSIDGRPLDPSAGLHGAVAVFHDITELRRYETDLAVFAGVVAHDLKAPLAVIRGHCETAADELADAPEGSQVYEARSAMDRIANAVDRMAALIDTLLAYTTSRDAPLKLATVPLTPLVADVVEQRTGHLRAAGTAPDVYVGRLPEVRADPGMLRHVLDNLVGNALKYVPIGRGARIDVTAEPGPPGWTRVEVADRGIGIPDADKPSIFDSFHRASSAVGYAGSGLGLAICRRVVERHGGTIGVADNPGGGTRFHFTLPLATPVLDRALAERAAVQDTAMQNLEIGPAGQNRPVAAIGPAGEIGPGEQVRPSGAASATPRTPGAGREGTA